MVKTEIQPVGDTFEYKVLYGRMRDKWREELEDLGKNGWEMVSAVYGEGSFNEYYFKRKILPPSLPINSVFKIGDEQFVHVRCNNCGQMHNKKVFDKKFEIGDIVAYDNVSTRHYRVDSISAPEEAVYHGTWLNAPDYVSARDSQGNLPDCRIDTRNNEWHLVCRREDKK